MVQRLAVFPQMTYSLESPQENNHKDIAFLKPGKLCWASASSGCPVGLTPLLWLWLYYNWILLWLNSASLVFLTPPPHGVISEVFHRVLSLQCPSSFCKDGGLLLLSWVSPIPQNLCGEGNGFWDFIAWQFVTFLILIVQQFLSIGTFGSCVKDSRVILRHASFSGV